MKTFFKALGGGAVREGHLVRKILLSEITNTLDGIKSSIDTTEIKTTVPGNIVVKITQSKDRKKRLCFVFKLKDESPVRKYQVV